MSAISVEIEKKKRAANSPLTGSGKESNTSDEPTTPATLKKSFASAAKTPMVDVSTSNPPAPDRSYFMTQNPQGSFRDEIMVEINTIDGIEFKGTITPREAIRDIFVDKLGFEKTALGSLTIGFSRGRIVTYKLIAQFISTHWLASKNSN